MSYFMSNDRANSTVVQIAFKLQWRFRIQVELKDISDVLLYFGFVE